MSEAETSRRTYVVVGAIALFVVLGGVALGLLATSGRHADQAAAREGAGGAHTAAPLVSPTPTEQEPDAAAATTDAGPADPTSSDGDTQAGADSHAQIDASGQISEERYIDISVRIMMAAIGFQNAGQGHAELEAYMPELLAKEGVTAEALQRATDELMKDPEQAERVSNEVVKRVERITGVQMDMNLIQQLDPNWKPGAG